MDVEPQYPWALAMQDARRRLSRLKAGVAVAGTVALGVVAVLAAAAGPVSAGQAPAPAAAPTVDAFGQDTPPGSDDQAPALNPAINPANPPPAVGQGQGQGTPRIVTAAS